MMPLKERGLTMGKIRDLATTVTAFKLNWIKGVEVYNKAVQYAKHNYIPSSLLYKETIEKYDNQFAAEKEAAVAKCTAEINAAFEDARGQVKKVVTDLPTGKDRAIIDMLRAGNLYPEETEILAEQVRNTYFGNKEVSAILKEEFTPVGSVIKTLDNAEKQTVRALGYIMANPDSSTAGAITKGEYLGEIEDKVTAFVSQYKK